MNAKQGAGSTVPLEGVENIALALDISGTAVHLHTGIPWESIHYQLAFLERKTGQKGIEVAEVTLRLLALL